MFTGANIPHLTNLDDKTRQAVTDWMRETNRLIRIEFAKIEQEMNINGKTRQA